MIAILLTLAPMVFSAWDRAVERVAYCASDGYCTLFAALDFKVVRLDAVPAGHAYVVERATTATSTRSGRF